MPALPVLHLRREGDRYVLGPIGWMAKMEDQEFAGPRTALEAAHKLSKISGCSLLFNLKPWRRAP